MGVVLVVLLALLAGCGGDVDVDPSSASSSSASAAGADASAAQRTLDRFAGALRNRRPGGDVAGLATQGAAELLVAAVANARSLDLRDVSLRYIDEAAPLTSTQRTRFGRGAWGGTVEVQYAVGGLDPAPARVETVVVFVRDEGATRIAGFERAGGRVPLWLTQRLAVTRGTRTLVAVGSGGTGRYPRLVEKAVTQVRRTLPDWRGPLVVEVPATRTQLDASLDAGSGEYDEIAAVTTTEDGSLASGAPVRVFVNPAVFDRLADRGAQVVMSHEVTHVATGATFTDVPTWLLEGFADFVALDRAGVPVSLAAGQILARIRRNGLPDGLPTSADLDPRANGLGATYEEAWLACRFLAQEFGAQRLVALYRSVARGTPERRAFREVLGIAQTEFVARWRVDLARLAGVEPDA